MRMFSVLAAAATAGLLASSAMAAEGARDRVHADSFGNLVIYSPAGYKRILVGMGHVAEAYRQTGSYYEPEVVEADVPRRALRCSRLPHVWYGRSHMYGLERGEIPQAPVVCR
jgi:hypothetical protein